MLISSKLSKCIQSGRVSFCACQFDFGYKPANYEAIKKFGYLPNVAGEGVMIVKASFI